MRDGDYIKSWVVGDDGYTNWTRWWIIQIGLILGGGILGWALTYVHC